MFYTNVAFSIHLYIVINDSYTIEEFFSYITFYSKIKLRRAKVTFRTPEKICGYR